MIHTQDADFTLICADVLDGLRSLPDESVHCVVTSPPYWGLRDYGTGLWAGGDEDCDHQEVQPQNREGRETPGGRGGTFPTSERAYREVCGKCGASRQDQQLGLEATPDLYVARIVEVFREVWRVLRADGTCWVNLGDSYAATQTSDRHMFQPTGPNGTPATTAPPQIPTMRTATGGLKPKDLVGIPWRVAFALQADGWYLRSDIIWAKPNPMPESVTDRPTKAHEYVFLLSKQARYFFDQEAVREPHRWQDADLLATNAQARQGARLAARRAAGDASAVRTQDSWNAAMNGARHKGRGMDANQESEFAASPAGRNVRSVWEIATQPYPEAHFATYPEELVRRCVLAGTSERGCCPVCGKPWEREVRAQSLERYELSPDDPRYRPARYEGKYTDMHGNGMRYHESETLGWNPACDCEHRDFYNPIPCTVLDPFIGSGTTAFVARKHGRRSIGIELNPAYADLAARRMQQQSLFALFDPAETGPTVAEQIDAMMETRNLP